LSLDKIKQYNSLTDNVSNGQARKRNARAVNTESKVQNLTFKICSFVDGWNAAVSLHALNSTL